MKRICQLWDSNKGMRQLAEDDHMRFPVQSMRICLVPSFAHSHTHPCGYPMHVYHYKCISLLFLAGARPFIPASTNNWGFTSILVVLQRQAPSNNSKGSLVIAPSNPKSAGISEQQKLVEVHSKTLSRLDE